MGGLTTRQLASRYLRKSSKQQRNQLQPGDMLQNRYRIMGTLGVGGFSAVYQARDMRFPTVTKLCAVKEMVNTAADPQLRELTVKSFEREANILATLDHTSIPTVYDYFSEGDRSYLVMEFIRGKDLGVLVGEQKTPFSADQVEDWALQITEVLSFLHAQKPQPVVFRDLKPSNIILAPNGRIHLIDFGIAKVFETGEKGTMVGTEGYSPPEQYRGEATLAGDVYAFGATFHHLLTLKDPRLEPPFSFTERPIINYNETVKPELAIILMRCLSYQMNERYPNGLALREALKQIIAARTDLVLVTAPLGQGTAKGAVASQTPDVTMSPAAGPEDATVTPLWVFRCEDEIRSKPAVDQGLVFVSTYDHNVYAINTESGEFVWKYATADGLGSSPTTHGGGLFIGSSDKNLYALDQRSGRLKWSFSTKGAIYSSPRIDYDHVFFGSDDGQMYAVNSTAGRLAWQIEAHGAVRSSPCIYDEKVYFGTEGGYVFCVDLSGKMKWQFQARRAVTSSPAVADDLVIVGSMDTVIYALDAGTGWAVWRHRTSGPIVSSPAVDDKNAYVGSADGALYAINISSGRRAWQYSSGGQIPSSPAIWEDAVYFGSTDGYVYCLDTKRGDLRWRFNTGEQVIGSPVIVDGIVYVGSSNHNLYALPT